MDVLSEVLKVVQLEGAVYYNGEFSAPWSFRSPASHRLAPFLAPGAGHMIIYHLLTEGHGFAEIKNGPRLSLSPGDIVVFPHGDSHLIGNGPVRDTLNAERELEKILAQGLKLVRMGGGGELTRLVCGYMACDPRLSKLFLAGLPPIFKINIRSDSSGQWLENSIRFFVGDVGSSRPGGEAVLAKLSEALFVETLRRYVAQLPEGQTGWLAGARDPEVGNVLALMHREPARPWTLADLAAEAGISRSVLAERFREFLGEPPMAYLTRWRLQLGAQMLNSTSYSVAQIAAEVGYESEPAFNRAFKRQFNLPPARFRAEAAKAPGKDRLAVAAQVRG
ncbi:MAG TPA: AraC family transcriptional regulator [Candidatus Angelobacter sp.]|jgi:AraC-like DNA-binding protein|nr:AraC family transcriptional regulator [Candidatus Angelobacter sp.]